MHGAPPSRRHKLWWWLAGSGVVVALLSVFAAIPGSNLLHQVTVMKKTVKSLEKDNSTHNFAGLSAQVSALGQEAAKLLATLHGMQYLGSMPIVGADFRDGEEAMTAVDDGLKGVQTLMPALARMAPLAGYRTRFHPSSSFSGGQKISAFVSGLPILGPALKRAYPDFVRAQTAFNKVQPKDFRGVLAPVGAKLATAQSLLNAAVRNMPLVYQSASALQNILGAPRSKRYLIIFQNSGELRATGGFMTAYAFVTLNHGRIGHITAQNMQLLDAQVTYRPPASTVIATYLPVSYWHLRDANTSPNVPTTVADIKRFYSSIPGAPGINGIIFIDTWFVDQLIGDVGGITVNTPRGAVTLNQSNANMKMEYMAEGQALPTNLRKKFIGTMMKTLLDEVMHSHGQELARVLSTVNESLNRKFILLNFNNPKAEALVKRYHWGGIMDRHVSGDYLSVVDENLLGHKDNFVMRYHIRTSIRRVGSRYQETASITYRDPAIDNGSLFVPYRSWVRFYVPMGSKLISIAGVDGIPYQVYNNTTVDKTVFGGHVDLPPRTSTAEPAARHTVTVTYWLPKGVSMKSLTVQLQPGVNHQTLSVTKGSYHQSVNFIHDVIFHFPAGAS